MQLLQAGVNGVSGVDAVLAVGLEDSRDRGGVKMETAAVGEQNSFETVILRLAKKVNLLHVMLLYILYAVASMLIYMLHSAICYML